MEPWIGLSGCETSPLAHQVCTETTRLSPAFVHKCEIILFSPYKCSMGARRDTEVHRKTRTTTKQRSHSCCGL